MKQAHDSNDAKWCLIMKFCLERGVMCKFTASCTTPPWMYTIFHSDPGHITIYSPSTRSIALRHRNACPHFPLPPRLPGNPPPS